MTFILPEPKRNVTWSTWGPPVGPDDDSNGMRLSLIDKSDREWATTGDWVEKTRERLKNVAVDSNRAAVFEQSTSNFGRGQGRGGFRGGRGSRGRGAGDRPPMGRATSTRGRSGGGGRGARKVARKPRTRTDDILYASASMRKKESSQQIAEFDLDDLLKLSGVSIPASMDLVTCGLPRVYNDKLETARVTAPKPLLEEAGENPTIFSRCTGKEDPELRAIVKQIGGTCPIVITTDEVLSTLMASSRSVHSWHVQFFRFNRITFIDKRPHGRIEEEWVAENNTEDGPTESDAQELDRITALAKESTEASRYFRRQCQLKSTAKGFKTMKSPFEKTSSMFKYRQYNIGDKADKYILLVRTEIDAVQNDQQLRIYGLLEHIPSQKDKTWNRYLDTARAAVLVNEVKVNKFKFARWIAQSILSGAQLMKIGFISRTMEERTVVRMDRSKGKDSKEDAKVTELRWVPRIFPKNKEDIVVDSNNKSTDLHVVVAVETAEPVQFATQTGVNIANMWSIVNLYITKFLAHTNGLLGYSYDADGELIERKPGSPSTTSAYLLKRVNERRLEMFEQEEDVDSDEEREEGEDEEGEDEEGDDEEGVEDDE